MGRRQGPLVTSLPQVLRLLSDAEGSVGVPGAKPPVSLTSAVSTASAVCDAVVEWLVDHLQALHELDGDAEGSLADLFG